MYAISVPLVQNVRCKWLCTIFRMGGKIDLNPLLHCVKVCQFSCRKIIYS